MEIRKIETKNVSVMVGLFNYNLKYADELTKVNKAL